MPATRAKTKAEGATLFEAKGQPLPERPAATKPKPVAAAVAPKQQAVAVRSPKSDNVVALNPRNMLAMIAKLAADKRVDAGKMRELLSMQKDVMAEQARIDFLEDFQKLKRDLPRVDRDGKIEIVAKGQDGQRVAGRDRVQQSTPYATYQNIRDKIDPILDRYGFTMWDETEPSADGSRIHVTVHLDHKSGHGRSTTFPLPAEVSGSKNNAQGWGSANSYGKRYGTINLLGILTRAPEDRDLNGNPPQAGETTTVAGDDEAVVLITDEQERILKGAIDFCGVGMARFLDKYQIEKLSDLPASLFADAKQACQDYSGKAKK